jgi:hypothetical protein
MCVCMLLYACYYMRVCMLLYACYCMHVRDMFDSLPLLPGSPPGSPQRQRSVPVPAGQVLRHIVRHGRQDHPVWPQGGLSQTLAHVEGQGRGHHGKGHRQRVRLRRVSAKYIIYI